MPETEDFIEKRIDGRTREGRAQRAAGLASDVEASATTAPTPTSARQATRQTTREPMREGRAQVRGRDGEVLTRKRTGVGDPFHVPPELLEAGYEMQWIAVSVVGNTEVVMDHNLQMLENGWRPVQAGRFPGRFMPAGFTGHIVRGGQGLYERPTILCEEARQEDIANARRLVSDRNESLKLSGVKDQLGPGFEMGRRYRGTGGDIRLSIDQALDVPAASHQLAEPGE